MENIRLIDRADGVRGHFCIGRKINPDAQFSIWEFWNSGRWLSAGQVFIGRNVAEAALKRVRQEMREADNARR